jgi:hypothetical protein
MKHLHSQVLFFELLTGGSMSKLTPAQERLAQALIDIQALKFGAF